MALHDWRVLEVATFFGQVRQDAATSEQVDAVKQIAALIREDTIHRIALDMDHARTGSTQTGHIPDGVEIDASGLAREMVDGPDPFRACSPSGGGTLVAGPDCRGQRSRRFDG